MKTKLLFTLFFATQLVSAQFYLNEVMLDPPGTDTPHNFIEIRGAANTTLANMYVITVEGDMNDPGDLDEIISLGTFSTGSNGIFVLAQTGNFYTIDSAANVGLDLFTGSGGEVESQSHTIMLIESTTTPSGGDDIDSVGGVGNIGDGTPDGSVYTSWTVHDSVSLLKDNGTGLEAYAYSTVVFLEDNEATTPTVYSPSGATIIATGGTQFDYVSRIGNKTGNALTNDETTSDWVGADLPGSSTPTMSGDFWIMSSNSSAIRAYPESFEGSELNHIGSANPSQNTTLSANDFLISDVKIYPNPALSHINIEVNNITILSVDVYSILGERVHSQKELINNRLDMSNLTSGIYFVKISSQEASVTKKIIIN